MDSRVVVSLLSALLVVALFAPASVAGAREPTGDDAVAAAGGGDAMVLDRHRPTVVSSGQARADDGTDERSGGRGNERTRGDADEPAGRHAGERAGRHADPDGVLEQPTRADVYAAVDSSPGETLAGLADAVGVTKSTVRYHVEVLRDAGLVAATEAAGALRVAPAEADAELAAALGAEGTGAVLDAVAEHEPASVTTVARATDRAPSTVSHHLSALEDRDLVERERAGEAVVTRLAPATRAALRAEASSADD
jgi:DNA-binding transcriptional ArsR family regulator